MEWGNCVVDGIPSLKCIPIIFNNLLTFAISGSAVVAVFFITLSGIKFLTSGGDPIKVSEAKKTFSYALIGLVVIILSFALIKVIGVVTGTDCRILGIEACKR